MTPTCFSEYATMILGRVTRPGRLPIERQETPTGGKIRDFWQKRFWPKYPRESSYDPLTGLLLCASRRHVVLVALMLCSIAVCGSPSVFPTGVTRYDPAKA